MADFNSKVMQKKEHINIKFPWLSAYLITKASVLKVIEY